MSSITHIEIQYPIKWHQTSTSDLIDTHTRRRNQRAKVYEKVYPKCCQRIRHANDILYAKECTFNVPTLELWGGTPLYQVNAVIGDIMIRLKQKGFDVRYLPPDGSFINWKKAVTGDNRKDNVIRYELDELNKQPTPKLIMSQMYTNVSSITAAKANAVLMTHSDHQES